MYGETLPAWFWVIYYLLLVTTIGTAIFSFAKVKSKILSVLAIVIALTIPIVSIVNGISRAEEMNEFEHLVSQLQQGASWSVFTIIGYLFLLVWWVLFFYKSRNKTQMTTSN
ncbi:hypothetical protein [Bacillus sp. PS06]|uniref:hypothetical protein n=1 Tax=Bacillus sp. PS06 TaxID=2764176 RepID=UPI00177DE772|nr:hypothetical protein [Bacillus sp. PS06]MBD8069736.1 hypothetical protein [Bacillus sp. PS06]